MAAVGKNVTDFKVGDRILSPMHSGGCGTCHYCSVKGVETQCAKKAWHAISRNGFFAEYCAVNPKNTVKIPEGVSFAQAGPIGCAGVTVYNALRKSGVRAGEWVGISGAGGLGQLAIQIAKTKGMKVLVLDVDDAKLETAKQLGADAVVNPRTEGEQTAEKVKAATDSGEGLDGVVVVTNANSAFESAPNFVRGAATVVFIGVPTAAIKIDPYAVLSKEMKIVGSFLGSRDVGTCDSRLEPNLLISTKLYICRMPMKRSRWSPRAKSSRSSPNASWTTSTTFSTKWITELELQTAWL